MEEIMSEPINTLTCDRCGHTEHLPLLEIPDDVPQETMEQVMPALFFAVKYTFGEQGWYTSVGLDVCPQCCKSIGWQPAYHENDLLPETIFIPRDQTP